MQQKRDVADFLNKLVASSCMRYVHQVLAAQGLVAPDLQGFRAQLHQMWFYPYRWTVSPLPIHIA